MGPIASHMPSGETATEFAIDQTFLLRRNHAKPLDRITVDPEVFGGRACIRGLRLGVKDIPAMLAPGALRRNPGRLSLSRSQMTFPLRSYAARHINHPVIPPRSL